MKKISLKSLVWKEGKHYVSQALNIDVASFGKTRREAVRNLVEALELYLESTSKPDIRKVDRPSIITNTIAYA